MTPLDVHDPRARRTLKARELLLRERYLRLQALLTVIDQLTERAVEADERLWIDGCRLWDDAEKLARHENQQKSRRKNGR